MKFFSLFYVLALSLICSLSAMDAGREKRLLDDWSKIDKMWAASRGTWRHVLSRLTGGAMSSFSEQEQKEFDALCVRCLSAVSSRLESARQTLLNLSPDTTPEALFQAALGFVLAYDDLEELWAKTDCCWRHSRTRGQLLYRSLHHSYAALVESIRDVLAPFYLEDGVLEGGDIFLRLREAIEGLGLSDRPMQNFLSRLCEGVTLRTTDLCVKGSLYGIEKNLRASPVDHAQLEKEGVKYERHLNNLVSTCAEIDPDELNLSADEKQFFIRGSKELLLLRKFYSGNRRALALRVGRGGLLETVAPTVNQFIAERHAYVCQKAGVAVEQYPLWLIWGMRSSEGIFDAEQTVALGSKLLFVTISMVNNLFLMPELLEDFLAHELGHLVDNFNTGKLLRMRLWKAFMQDRADEPSLLHHLITNEFRADLFAGRALNRPISILPLRLAQVLRERAMQDFRLQDPDFLDAIVALATYVHNKKSGPAFLEAVVTKLDQGGSRPFKRESCDCSKAGDLRYLFIHLGIPVVETLNSEKREAAWSTRRPAPAGDILAGICSAVNEGNGHPPTWTRDYVAGSGRNCNMNLMPNTGMGPVLQVMSRSALAIPFIGWQGDEEVNA